MVQRSRVVRALLAVHPPVRVVHVMVPATRVATGVAQAVTGRVANAEGDLIVLIVRTALIALSVLGAPNAVIARAVRSVALCHAMVRAVVGEDPQELTTDALRDPELMIAIGHAGKRT